MGTDPVAIGARHDRRWDELDGVRACAVLAVIAGHARIERLTGGGTGVLVFFVLSGFLITSLLVREQRATGTISLRNFYVRRTLRIWPAAYVALIGYGAYALTQTGTQVEAKQTLHAIPWAFVFLTNVYELHHPVGWLPHFWSLAVEEQFYLTWPLLCVVALRRGWSLRRLGVWALVAAAVSMVEKVVLWRTHHAGADAGLLDRAADGLLLGSALALFLAAGTPQLVVWLRRLFWPAVAVLIVVVVVPDWTDPSGETFRESVLWDVSIVAAAVAIGALVTGRIPVASDFLASRPMRFVGHISYAVYLWHYLVLVVVQYHPRFAYFTHHSRVERYLADLVGSLVLGAASTFLLERPFLRLKARFESTPEERDRSLAEA